MTTEQIDHAVCIPVLPSLDTAATKDFYVSTLGFAEVIYDEAHYLIVRRGRMELHFWLTTETTLPSMSSCYIRGGEVPALYRVYASRSVPRLSDFQVRAWNMKEFYVHDPHGNLLRFGCAPEEEA